MTNFNRGDLCKTNKECWDYSRDKFSDEISPLLNIKIKQNTFVEVLGIWQDFEAFKFCWLPTQNVYVAIHCSRLLKL